MKVILAFPQQDGQTGLFIKRAFIDLGHEVIVVDAKTESHVLLSRSVSFKPDIVFCSRTSELLSGVKQIKMMNPNCVIVIWNTDKRNNIAEYGQPKLLDFF